MRRIADAQQAVVGLQAHNHPVAAIIDLHTEYFDAGNGGCNLRAGRDRRQRSQGRCRGQGATAADFKSSRRFMIQVAGTAKFLCSHA